MRNERGSVQASTGSSWRSRLACVVLLAAWTVPATAVLANASARDIDATISIDRRANGDETAERIDDPVIVPPATTPVTTTGSPTTMPTFGFDATPPSSAWVRPDLLAPSFDPAYGTPVRRMTTADDTRFDRNTYSRRQAENADGSLIMTYHGSARYRVYSRVAGQLVRELSIHPDAEPQWHPTSPNRIRHISGSDAAAGDLRYYETDVTTGSTRRLADLTTRVQRRFPTARYLADRAEGSPSADGNRHAWIVFDASDSALAIVSYELSSNTVLAMLPIEAGGIDWVSASPTGGFVVAGYGDKTVVYDAGDLSNRRLINRKADHSDIALSADGSDSYVYIDFSADTDAGWLVAVDLTTLDRTRIFDLYDGANTSLHVSGKGYAKPGWVVISTYNCKEPGAWSCDKVLAVEIGGSRRVLNLAHTYNCGDDYWTETHAVVNRSFTRVYFNSDSGSCGIDAEVYELTLPTFE